METTLETMRLGSGDEAGDSGWRVETTLKTNGLGGGDGYENLATRD